MNPEIVIDMAVEAVVTWQSLSFIKKHPVGMRRYVALIAVVVSISGVAMSIARLVVPALPELHLTEEIILYIIIYLFMIPSPATVVDQDDYANIHQRCMKCIQSIEEVEKRLTNFEESVTFDSRR